MEIKATDKDSVPRPALLPHQEAALRAASGKGLVYKISDAARLRVPFDAFMLQETPAYVVAAFTTHRIALVFTIEKWNGANFKQSALFRISI